MVSSHNYVTRITHKKYVLITYTIDMMVTDKPVLLQGDFFLFCKKLNMYVYVFRI